MRNGRFRAIQVVVHHFSGPPGDYEFVPQNCTPLAPCARQRKVHRPGMTYLWAEPWNQNPHHGDLVFWQVENFDKCGSCPKIHVLKDLSTHFFWMCGVRNPLISSYLIHLFGHWFLPVPSIPEWFHLTTGPRRGRHGSVGLRGRVLRRGLRQEHPGRLEVPRGRSHQQQLGLTAGGWFGGFERAKNMCFSFPHCMWEAACLELAILNWCPVRDMSSALPLSGSSLFLTPTSLGTWPTPAAPD